MKIGNVLITTELGMMDLTEDYIRDMLPEIAVRSPRSTVGNLEALHRGMFDSFIRYVWWWHDEKSKTQWHFDTGQRTRHAVEGSSEEMAEQVDEIYRVSLFAPVEPPQLYRYVEGEAFVLASSEEEATQRVRDWYEGTVFIQKVSNEGTGDNG